MKNRKVKIAAASIDKIKTSAVAAGKIKKASGVAAGKIKTSGVAAGKIKKVVLAYSGGLDTSVILKWLQENYGCEVITFTADLGQGEELEPARIKAKKMGVKQIFIEDLREEFVRDYVFPMFRANTLSLHDALPIW